MSEKYNHFVYGREHQKETLNGRFHRLVDKILANTGDTEETLLSHIHLCVKAIKTSKMTSIDSLAFVYHLHELHILEFLARLDLFIDEPTNQDNIAQLALLTKALPETSDINEAKLESIVCLVCVTLSIIGIAAIFTMLNPTQVLLFLGSGLCWFAVLALDTLAERYPIEPSIYSTSVHLEICSVLSFAAAVVFTFFSILSSVLLAYSTMFLTMFGCVGGLMSAYHKSCVAQSYSSLQTVKTDIATLTKDHGLFRNAKTKHVQKPSNESTINPVKGELIW